MLEMLKRALAAIAKRRKILAWTPAAILLALTLAIALRKFPAVRIPTAAVAVGVFLILLLWLFPKWQVSSIVGLDSKDRFAHENEGRQTLSQILGGLALLIGFYFTWQNLVLTREGQVEAEKAAQENLRIGSEGQITDRFTKAIAQLGDTKLEIRLGGIYALERISKDSPKDHWPIMEVLTAYVREHAKINPQSKMSPKTSAQLTKNPASDIQAILTVISRRTLTFEKGERMGLDLREVDLRNAVMSGANLSGTSFADADLSGAFLAGGNLDKAILMRTDLTGTNFVDASLNAANLSTARLKGALLIHAKLLGADLTKANLSGAILTSADLSGTKLTGADFSGAFLNDANLSTADLGGTDLARAHGLSSAQLESAKGNAATQLPPGLPHPKSWQ